MVLCLGEPPRRFLLLLIFISFLIFILLLFFICRCSSFTLAFRHHLFEDCRQVFTPILYFQPCPLQSDSWHFHFQPFRYLLTASATVLSWHFLLTLCSFTTILLVFIKAFLGASSSSLKFAGLHTDPWNTDLTRLFVWFTVIHSLNIQNNSVLNSTKYYPELLVVKV